MRDTAVREPSSRPHRERRSDRPRRNPPYLALRTDAYLYVEYVTGEQELYDLRRDPNELQNLAATADSALLERLSADLDQLRLCAAAECRSAEDDVIELPDGG